MMKNISSKIKKLIKALEIRGEIYLFTKEQIYSCKLEKICILNRLSYLMPASKYYAMHPEKKRRKNDNREYVKYPIVDSFKEIDILLELVEIYKAGDASG